MNVISSNRKDINIVTLIHKNKDIKFQCIPHTIYGTEDLEEKGIVEITFDDLKEVDDLIYMLEKFKEKCIEYMGSWCER